MKLIIHNRHMIFFAVVFIVFLPLSWAQFVVGSIYRMVAIITFGIYILVKRGKFKVIYANRKLFSIWTIYIFYSFLSVIWATNVSSALNNSFALLLLYFIVFIFLTINITIDQRNLIDKCWLLVGFFCFILYVFGDKAQIGEYGSRTSLTILGTATDPNEFSSIFIVPVSIAVYFIIISKKVIEKIICLALIISALYVGLLSGSRGGLFSILLAIIITVIMYLRPSPKLFIGIILSFLIIGAIVIYVILPNIPEDLLVRFSLNTLLDDGGSGRDSLWIGAFQEIFSGSIFRLLFGYGQYGLFINDMGTMHNQLLQNLTNYGVIGLLLYLTLLIYTYKVICSRWPYYRGAFWGMMLMSMTITMSTAYKPLWIFLLTPALCSTNAK